MNDKPLMADDRTEPSMEDILASIKRIIADDGPGAGDPAREKDTPPPADTVLELTEPVTQPASFRDATSEGAVLSDSHVSPDADDTPAPVLADPVPSPAAPATPKQERPIQTAPSSPALDHAPTPPVPLVSENAAGASRQSLAALASVARPQPTETSLEGLVREMLRPMLREWLDAHLPKMVETLVAREIARITAQDD